LLNSSQVNYADPHNTSEKTTRRSDYATERLRDWATTRLRDLET